MLWKIVRARVIIKKMDCFTFSFAQKLFLVGQ